MIADETLAWLANAADALLVVTAGFAFYFRWRAFRDRPADNKGERPSWGGEFTAAGSPQRASPEIMARAAQSALWNKLLLVSFGMAAAANLAIQ